MLKEDKLYIFNFKFTREADESVEELREALLFHQFDDVWLLQKTQLQNDIRIVDKRQAIDLVQEYLDLGGVVKVVPKTEFLRRIEKYNSTEKSFLQKQIS